MDSITQFLNQLLQANGATLGWGDAGIALVFAYLGGILSSLTPCVYPMIPITIGVVGGVNPVERSWSQVFLRSLSYVLGMTVVYSFLGILAGLSGRVFGSFTQTSGWYMTLGTIMTFAALVMLEILPFDPGAWWAKLRQKLSSSRPAFGTPSTPKLGAEMTALGAFFLGSSSGLIAAPCTTPVLTSILAYIAKTQSVGLGFSLMICFSLGLGTLLLVIATFTGALQVLPKSGQWMKTLKAISGLILLAFAEYLIYQSGRLGGFSR
ncbi:MAG: cytochrome c biogenesis protein CcdA [Bdellovibrionia bacterium]